MVLIVRHLTLVMFSLLGYPRNPFNDVICNDTISASGVFTAKELCRLSRGTLRPRDTRPWATRALQIHGFLIGPKLFSVTRMYRIIVKQPYCFLEIFFTKHFLSPTFMKKGPSKINFLLILLKKSSHLQDYLALKNTWIYVVRTFSYTVFW